MLVYGICNIQKIFEKKYLIRTFPTPNSFKFNIRSTLFSKVSSMQVTLAKDIAKHEWVEHWLCDDSKIVIAYSANIQNCS